MERTHDREIWRISGEGRPLRDVDALAVEAPLEIRVRNTTLCLTMRTPGHDEELAIGFLLAERIVREREDVWHAAPCPGATSHDVLNVSVAPEIASALDGAERFTITSSSCGVCGKRSLDALLDATPIESDVTVAARTLFELTARMRAAQAVFGRTGGLHAAAIFDESGVLVAVREDIGRHNAVDKLLGYSLVRGLLPWSRHVLLVSGRASFEIVQKAAAGGVPIIASVSAPSTLAVSTAERNGQTLIGFLRDERANVYCHPQRIGAEMAPVPSDARAAGPPATTER